MEELFSSFSISFQANSLFPKLVISVGFYPEKIENLEDLPLFYPYFFEFTRFIHTLVSSSHKNESILTLFKKTDFSIDFSTDFSIDFNSFLFFLFLVYSLGNSIPVWNEIKTHFILFHTATLVIRFCNMFL